MKQKRRCEEIRHQLTTEERIVASALHSSMCGWNCSGHGILQPIQDELYARGARVAILALDKHRKSNKVKPWYKRLFVRE